MLRGGQGPRRWDPKLDHVTELPSLWCETGMPARGGLEKGMWHSVMLKVEGWV